MNFIKKAKHFVGSFIKEYMLIPLAYKDTSKFIILDSMESIQYIIDNHCSLSRFGDGEFDSIIGSGGDYQHPSTRLSKMLLECLQSNLPNHQVAIPLTIKNKIKGEPAINFWSLFVLKHHRNFRKWLSEDRFYLDSLLSRFYYIQKNKELCAGHIELIKKIWDNKDVVIIEGCKTRSGIGNDLYSNTKSIKRILGPALSGFDKYDDIYSFVKTNVPINNLILLSYGIAATVLAYEFAKLGYQAIDIGHLDIEYEWYRLRAKDRVAIPGKYTNEVVNGNYPSDKDIDPIYYQQIIADFS